MTNSNSPTIVGAFQTWGDSYSSLVLASKDGQEEVDEFVKRSEESFAHLNSFSDEEEALRAYLALC